VLVLAGLIGLSGCSAATLPPGLAANASSGPAALEKSPGTGMTAGNYIKHVVLIIQENRSFDNLFAGFPGAESQLSGYMHTGQLVNLQPLPFEQLYIDHYYEDARTDYDGGKMDGFDLNPSLHGPVGALAYSYVQRSQVRPYWYFAKHYVLADHMFPTMMGPSFTAHLTLIAGTADLNPALSEVDVPKALPWGCDAPPGTTTDTLSSAGVETSAVSQPPCFDQFNTMADTLDAAHVTWKYYAPPLDVSGGATWTSFDAIQSVRYGPDWSTKIVVPSTEIFKDVAKGRLPKVTWIIPDALWSDHPDDGTPYGPSWVGDIVNAIGTSKLWKSTAIVVVWDDWGGWYDDLPPPQLDFRGLGLRVPCLIISPYVRAHVSHTQYEFGSILHFMEDVFSLPSLGSVADGYTDARAASLVDTFDFTIKPRPYQSVTTQYPASWFLQQQPSYKPVDDE